MFFSLFFRVRTADDRIVESLTRSALFWPSSLLVSYIILLTYAYVNYRFVRISKIHSVGFFRRSHEPRRVCDTQRTDARWKRTGMRFGRSHAEAHKLPTRREDGVRTAKTSRGAWAEKFAKIEIPTRDPMIYGPVESRRVG